MYSYTGEEWIPPDTVMLKPDIGAIDMTSGRQIKSGLLTTLQCQDQIQWFTDQMPERDYEKILGVEFEHKDEWAEGRRESVQGVFFGYLALGNEVETPVAVKPFLSAISTGAHETALLIYLQDKGLPVYEVLGASWSEDQGFAMITKFEEDSRSLDNIDWEKGIEAPLSAHLTNLDGIKQVGRTLGLLHGNGVIHGDAQVKNFAVNGAEVRLVDLAQAEIVATSDAVNETKLRVGMRNDLSLLIESIHSKGFIKGGTAAQQESFFDSVIATSYQSGMFEAGEEITSKIDMTQVTRHVIEEARYELRDTLNQ